MKKIKLIILSLIVIGSIVFFWQYLNRFLTQSKASQDKVTISFPERSVEFKQNEEKIIGLTLNTSSGKKISAIDLRFKFDSDDNDLLDLIDYFDPLNYFTDRIIESVQRIDGAKQLRLVLVARKSSDKLQSSLTLGLKFRSKKTAGESSISIISGESQIVGPTEGNFFNIETQNDHTNYKINIEIQCSSDTDCGDYATCNSNLCGCAAGYYNCDGNWENGCESNTDCSSTIPTSTSTLTPTQAASLRLNLALRFQGIVNQCPQGDKKIKVRVKLGGIAETDYQQTDFSCNQGVWNGSVSFDAHSGSGYVVYIKGEKHLQKKICDQTPQESRLGPGTYSCSDGQIDLYSEENNLDFTGIINLYGDLPVGGEQDGVINSLDSSYIRNNLGKSDPEVLAICDGNLDGKCDTQDWSMLIMSLSIKGDEL